MHLNRMVNKKSFKWLLEYDNKVSTIPIILPDILDTHGGEGWSTYTSEGAERENLHEVVKAMIFQRRSLNGEGPIYIFPLPEESIKDTKKENQSEPLFTIETIPGTTAYKPGQSLHREIRGLTHSNLDAFTCMLQEAAKKTPTPIEYKAAELKTIALEVCKSQMQEIDIEALVKNTNSELIYDLVQLCNANTIPCDALLEKAKAISEEVTRKQIEKAQKRADKISNPFKTAS